MNDIVFSKPENVLPPQPTFAQLDQALKDEERPAIIVMPDGSIRVERRKDRKLTFKDIGEILGDDY